EGAVRARALQARGTAYPGRAVVSVPQLLDQLGAAQLVEIVDVDGTLIVLVCGKGRGRQVTAGRPADATLAAAWGCNALRRLARSRPGNDLAPALAILRANGPKLQDTLLGAAVRHLGDQPVIIVPPGNLHAIPWALLPALSERVVSVAPSATAWLRA